MKGMQGLIVAGMLGVLGVALNWIYLQGKTKDVASISFLGVKATTEIESGQPFKSEQLVPVKIPERHAGNLKDFVYLYEDLGTLVGVPATRNYEGGELVLREIKRPPEKLKLRDAERLIWIPVNSDSFVPELIDPGDEIKFVFPLYEPAEAPREADVTAVPSGRGTPMDEIGPFRVASLGTRLASREVARGNRMQTTQERLIGIVVDQNNKKEVDDAGRIQSMVLAGNYQDIGVALTRKAQ